MIRTAILAAILSVGFGAAAMAQTTTTPADSGTSMAATKGAVLASPGDLKKGANSFTEAQAKSRIEDFGFTNVTALTKDVNGVWWGTASKDAKSVKIGLDFQGNIAAE
jgi:hypothetical protein